MQDITKVIIAHRISAVRHANEIVILKDGKVAERGTHESLMQQKGLYYDTYVAQYEEPEESACGAGEEEVCL
jgi:ATP-binding cassette subfamily B protein